MHQALPGIGAQCAAQDATQGAAQCAARARSQGRHRGRIDARRASRRRHWHVPTRLQQARRGQAAGWQCGNSGKACEGGQVCESRRAGTGGTANTCETQEFRGLLVPAASAVAGALAVRSARLLESHRCSLPTCECPGDDLLATRCRFGPARKSISCLSISARVRRFATPGKSR